MISELMARYAAVSATLEERNRQLTAIDTARLEAQKIAKLGNWYADLATRRLSWSETMFSLFEMDPSVSPDVPQYLQQVHPEDRDTVSRYIENLFSGTATPNLTYRIVTRSGRIKWVTSHQIVDADSNGNFISIHGTLQDITAAKADELELQKYNDRLQALVQEKVQEIFSAQMATIYALVKLAESRDDDTGEHIERTSKYCRLIAEKLREDSPYASQIDDAFIRNIAMAGPLHDIGKVGIPDRILLKPGRLTPEEFDIMKTHVTIGYQTLSSVEKTYPGNAFLKMGMDIARYHHERWNGSGYQGGLCGVEIPLSARILALGDVYDALRSRRVYKEPFDHETSMRILLKGSGAHFDPVIADLFSRNHLAFRDIFDHSVRETR